MDNESRLSKEDIQAVSFSVKAVFARRDELVEKGMSVGEATDQVCGEIDDEKFDKWESGILINYANAISPPGKRGSNN